MENIHEISAKKCPETCTRPFCEQCEEHGHNEVVHYGGSDNGTGLLPEQAEEALMFLRDKWNRLGARACPACVYERGKFIRSCKLCEERHQLRLQLDTLTQQMKIQKDAVEALLAVLPATGDPALHREGCGEESEQPELCDCGVEAERLAVVEKLFQLDEPPF